MSTIGLCCRWTATAVFLLILVIDSSTRPTSADRIEARENDKCTPKQNIAYIKTIISQLNSRYKCRVPSYLQVDALFRAIYELQSQLDWEGILSEDKETYTKDSSLKKDIAVARKTVLLNWESYRQKYEDPHGYTMMPKVRDFVSRIEKYQREKYGISICNKVKDGDNWFAASVLNENLVLRCMDPSSFRDFEKEDDQLLEEAKQQEVSSVDQAAGEEVGKGEEAPVGQHERGLEREPPTNEETKHNSPNTPAAVDSMEAHEKQADDLRPGEHHSHRGLNLEHQLDLDPRDDVPTIKSIDHGEHNHRGLEDLHMGVGDQWDQMDRGLKPEVASVQSGGSGDEQWGETRRRRKERESRRKKRAERGRKKVAPKEDPFHDEFGALYVDIGLDDQDLAQMARPPAQEWQSDPVLESFRWPDEGEQEAEPVLLDPTVGSKWNEFLANPEAFDRSMDEQCRWRKPNKMRHVSKFESKVCWSYESEPMSEPEMEPECGGQWVKVANKKVCKMGQNKKSIKKTTKVTSNFDTGKSWPRTFVPYQPRVPPYHY